MFTFKHAKLIETSILSQVNFFLIFTPTLLTKKIREMHKWCTIIKQTWALNRDSLGGFQITPISPFKCFTAGIETQLQNLNI